MVIGYYETEKDAWIASENDWIVINKGLSNYYSYGMDMYEVKNIKGEDR